MDLFSTLRIHVQIRVQSHGKVVIMDIVMIQVNAFAIQAGLTNTLNSLRPLVPSQYIY